MNPHKQRCQNTSITFVSTPPSPSPLSPPQHQSLPLFLQRFFYEPRPLLLSLGVKLQVAGDCRKKETGSVRSLYEAPATQSLCQEQNGAREPPISVCNVLPVFPCGADLGCLSAICTGALSVSLHICPSIIYQFITCLSIHLLISTYPFIYLSLPFYLFIYLFS